MGSFKSPLSPSVAVSAKATGSLGEQLHLEGPLIIVCMLFSPTLCGGSSSRRYAWFCDEYNEVTASLFIYLFFKAGFPFL